ncbi:MAG: adenosylcobinamide-GDP ribazoletransferase [Methanomicrobiales archaeon]|nr:adenosylcobinamide-GDP ribazoletransferase [Methanomicrobiales archaeon]
MKSLIALLQFATILPLGKMQDLSHFGRRLYVYPVAGYVVGGIAALAVWWWGHSALAAAIALALVLVVSGFHHFDGLLDLGDALMAQGDREKRIRALTDRQVGAGGIGIGFVTTLLAFGALIAVPSAAVAILVSEVCAKVAMAVLTIFGTPFKEGIQSYLHQYARPWFFWPALLFFLPLLLVVRPGRLLVLVIVTLVVAALMLVSSRRLFGGVNGDIVGATNEITRALTLVTMVLIL